VEDLTLLMKSRTRRRTILGATAVVALSLALSSCGGGSPPSSSSSASSTLTNAIDQLNQGNDAVAVADFLAVIKKEPSNHIAWYNLGVIAEKAGQDTQAVRDYVASIAGDATYVPALYNLAILETPAHPTTAETLYQRVINAQPGDAAAHLNLGFLLESLGERMAGQEQLARAVELEPTLNTRVPSSAESGG
jgi:Tfp pilus assembly protein PilF